MSKEEIEKTFFLDHCERNASGNIVVSSKPREVLNFFYSAIDQEEVRDKAIQEGSNMIRMIRDNIYKKGENELYGYCDQKIKELEKLKLKSL